MNRIVDTDLCKGTAYAWRFVRLEYYSSMRRGFPRIFRAASAFSAATVLPCVPLML